MRENAGYKIIKGILLPNCEFVLGEKKTDSGIRESLVVKCRKLSLIIRSSPTQKCNFLNMIFQYGFTALDLCAFP